LLTNLQLQRLASRRLPPPTTRRLCLITGARQVGKTTLARSTYPGLRYLNLDAVEDRLGLRETPTARWAEEVGPAILDEAQKEPTLFEKVKHAYDAGAIRFSVLLGSAQILMLQRIRETLAGRAFIYELWPLTLGELAAAGGEPKPPLLARLLEDETPFSEVLGAEPRVLLGDAEAARVAALRHLGQWGGMPELLHLNDADRRQWLRSYHDTYLQRDLADLARLSDLHPFSTFQRLAALRTGGLLSYAELARDAGVSPATARNYLEYLKLSYQAFLLQPFRENLTSSVVKTPKLYWTDIGIARHLTGSSGPLSGSLFETFVIGEAIKLIRTLGLEVESFFYRTRSGMEVDGLLSSSRGVLALEAKARPGWAPSDLSGMRALADALGVRFRGGLVVTSGGALERASSDGRFWCVPAHRLFS
jgi:predicted AAA+ superfamily ATPase